MKLLYCKTRVDISFIEPEAWLREGCAIPRRHQAHVHIGRISRQQTPKRKHQTQGARAQRVYKQAPGYASMASNPVKAVRPALRLVRLLHRYLRVTRGHLCADEAGVAARRSSKVFATALQRKVKPHGQHDGENIRKNRQKDRQTKPTGS